MERNISVVKDVNGNQIVIVNDIRFKGKRNIDWDEVEQYLKQYVGEFIEIAESKEIIYIGSDLPDEYSGSNYTAKLKGALAKAKANAAQGIPEIIEIAGNRRFRENLERKHDKNAKYGWFRYDSRFAIPVFDENNDVLRYNVFHAELVIRHSEDRRLYLYDIINIKKKRAPRLSYKLYGKKPASLFIVYNRKGKKSREMYQKIDLDKIDINAEPPIEEPARQYYFMAKCRQYVKAESERLGRSLFCCTTTFGCQMNARDSEKLAGILEAVGYLSTDSEQADFVIYNTCTVRDNANQRVYGRLGELNRYKKANPQMKVALCGCMMQEPTVIEKLQKSYPFIDLIFGTHNLYKFAEFLCASFETEGMLIDIWEDTDKIVEDLPVERKYPFKSGINIMFGCNNFCSYCIVPYVRGRERSREPEEILREIERLVADGVVEVMLLGQNVNSYGKNLDRPVTFAGLLREVEKIEGLKRIRFMTSHPKDLSDELIEVMKQSKKICRHLHLPLQSGSTRILERMNRRYTKEQYLELAERIRREIPDISITTDIIVGFPGETKEDLEETLDVVRRVKYDNAFTFIYSRRTGTPAAAMEDQVPADQVRQNFERLLKLVQDTAREQVAKYQGQVQEALIEEVNESDASLVTGRLSNNTIVHVPGDASLIGRIVPVSLDECHGFYYIGHCILDETGAE